MIKMCKSCILQKMQLHNSFHLVRAHKHTGSPVRIARLYIAIFMPLGPYFELSTLSLKNATHATQNLIALFSPKLVWALQYKISKTTRIYLHYMRQRQRQRTHRDRYVIAAAVECPKMDSPFSANCNLLFCCLLARARRSYSAHS